MKDASPKKVWKEKKVYFYDGKVFRTTNQLFFLKHKCNLKRELSFNYHINNLSFFSDNFSCMGQTISAEQMCDGVNDCKGADESSCGSKCE